MGDERAETYLRVLAEAKFRQVLRPPGWRLDLLGTHPAGGWPEALMSLGNVGPEVLLPVASAGSSWPRPACSTTTSPTASTPTCAPP